MSVEPYSIRVPALSEPRAPLDTFCRPLPLAAVALLLLNDHLLKGSGLMPAAVTGKLSDFAGLFFFPLFLAALVVCLRRAPCDAELLTLACAIATGVVFTAIKVSPAASAAYEQVIGALRVGGRATNVCDPTDLIALPMLALSVLYAGGGWGPVPSRIPGGSSR